MAYKHDIDALTTADIALTGDGWAGRVSALLTALVPALQALAQAVDDSKTEIDSNNTAAAQSDLSNVSESDLVRRVLNNPGSLANGTLLQVRDGLIEPLAQSSLETSGNIIIDRTQQYTYRHATAAAPTEADYTAALAAFWRQGSSASELRLIIQINEVVSGSDRALNIVYLPIRRLT